MSARDRIALALIVAISCAIVASVRYLPMNDASGHVATSMIGLRLLERDPFFAEHYRFLPLPLPYWATTFGMIPLIPLVGPFTALTLLMLAYVLALAPSFHYLMKTAAPENARLSLVAALTAFHWSYWRGETNHLIGLPIAILALACFIRLRDGGTWPFWRFVALSLAAYVCHIYTVTAILISVGALACLSLVSGWLGPQRRHRLSKAQWAAGAWLLAVFLAGAYFVFLQHGSSANRGVLRFDLSLGKLGYYLGVRPFAAETTSYWLACLGFVGLLGAVLVVPWVGELKRDAKGALAKILNLELLVPALALIAVAYLGPVGIDNPEWSQWGGGEKQGISVAVRFVLMGFLLALGAVRLSASPRWNAALTLGVVLFGGLKLWDDWQTHRRNDAEVRLVSRDVLAAVPLHSRVLPLRDMSRPTFFDGLQHRMVNYVVVERESYSPHVFAEIGKHALRHVHWGENRSILQEQFGVEEWDYYDFVLVQTDRERPRIAGLEERTTALASAGRFRLYRIAAAAKRATP